MSSVRTSKDLWRGGKGGVLKNKMRALILFITHTFCSLIQSFPLSLFIDLPPVHCPVFCRFLGLPLILLLLLLSPLHFLGTALRCKRDSRVCVQKVLTGREFYAVQRSNEWMRKKQGCPAARARGWSLCVCSVCVLMWSMCDCVYIHVSKDGL